MRLRLAVLVALLAMGLSVAAWSQQTPSRTFDFKYTAQLAGIPTGADRVEAWLPIPVSDEHQDITALTVEAGAPVALARDAHGNQMLYAHIDDPAAEAVEIRFTARVTRREHAGTPARLSDRERREYLRAERLVPITGVIRRLAQEHTAGKTTDLEKARAIYDYVTNAMTYDKTGDGWGRGDALYACDALKGNCTDFHSLIIGMARAAGIPARFAMGFPLPSQRGEGEIPGYHCWAELYIEGRAWLPVDSSEASKRPALRDYFFGRLDENRVQLTTGRDLVLEPKQAGAPLNYFVYPYVEVDGTPLATVTRQFGYADVSGAPLPRAR